jgi:hypothetical protein
LFNLNGYGQQAKLLPDHSPKRAAVMSAMLPGLGQAYNKKYWKMPLVYAALGATIYGISFNNKKYQLYKDAYIIRLDGDANTVDDFDPSTGAAEVYTESQLRTLQDFYRDNRDLSGVLTVLAYAINILDAYVDAHLFYFDVSDDLSANWSPVNIPSATSKKSYPGLRLSFNF